jgi:hypothetical protein
MNGLKAKLPAERAGPAEVPIKGSKRDSATEQREHLRRKTAAPNGRQVAFFLFSPQIVTHDKLE